MDADLEEGSCGDGNHASPKGMPTLLSMWTSTSLEETSFWFPLSLWSKITWNPQFQNWFEWMTWWIILFFSNPSAKEKTLLIFLYHLLNGVKFYPVFLFLFSEVFNLAVFSLSPWEFLSGISDLINKIGGKLLRIKGPAVIQTIPSQKGRVSYPHLASTDQVGTGWTFHS